MKTILPFLHTRMLHGLLGCLLTLQFISLAHAQEPEHGLRFAHGDRILFLGDSITQDGRYVAFIETYLWAAYPHLDLKVVNMGVSAETVSNTTEPGHGRRPWVHDRVAPALEIARPDWVFICYGMNDGNYYPARDDIQRAYLDNLERLIDLIHETGAQIILLNPPPFDPISKPQKNLLPPGQGVYGYSQTYSLYDDTLVALGALAKGRFGHEVAMTVDIHTPLADYITTSRQQDADYQYGDGVHPPLDGHLAFALAVLHGIGESSEKAHQLLTRLTGVDLKTNSGAKEATEPQKQLWQSLLDRFNPLSRAYRENTFPGLNRKPLELAPTISQAADQEAELRAKIQKALNP
ncbi:MAG: SGNH/GDSL hydrolase family protein [Limisphaerales bacterium]